MTSSTVKKALQLKVESSVGCGAILLGNSLCNYVIDHVTKSVLKKASRVEAESQKMSEYGFCVCRIKCCSSNMPHPEEGTAFHSRKPERLLRKMLQITNGRKWYEDTLKMTNRSSLLLADDDDE